VGKDIPLENTDEFLNVLIKATNMAQKNKIFGSNPVLGMQKNSSMTQPFL